MAKAAQLFSFRSPRVPGSGRGVETTGVSMDVQLKRVLLVDDDEEILETTRLALQDRGYEVLVARDGAEALVRAERDSPDLIVLDVVMPKRSGFAVLKRIHNSRRSAMRIMVVTGNDECRHREYAVAHGADAFLKKPFDMHVFLDEVDSLLRLKSAL